MSTTEYISATDAVAYFNERLNTIAWDSASLAHRTKALKQATKDINRLNFVGSVSVTNQANAFPRGGDTSVPQPILDACCEIAYALLDGIDVELEKANLGATNQGMGDARTTYDRAFAPQHIVNGIASSTAWDLLMPFLHDPNDMKLSRGS